MLVLSVTYGNSTDSLKIVNLQQQIEELKSQYLVQKNVYDSLVALQKQQAEQLNVFTEDLSTANSKIKNHTRLQKNLESKIQAQSEEIDSLCNELNSMRTIYLQQRTSIDSLGNKVVTGFSETNSSLENAKTSLSNVIKNRTWIAVIGVSVSILLLAIVYFIFRKKIKTGDSTICEVNSTINEVKSAQDALKKAQETMQEESLKLDNQLLQLLNNQLQNSIQPTTNTTPNLEPDHSLVKKVADEIVRIETNLSRMDSSVKGYKQLSKAVERIRNNFLANGYEIVQMLGMPYNSGMKVTANFVSDETLAEGEKIITGITKPQINYNGKMIQSAEITVSQNI